MKKSPYYEIERPACIVEFALIALVLLTMLYGAMEGVRYVFADNAWGLL